MKLFSFLSHILDYIYYRKCYICSKCCTDISICQNCWDKIFSNLSFQKAKKFGTVIYSSAIYEGDIVKIIRALKYHKKREFEKVLSDMIEKTIEHFSINVEDFVICPVPIHVKRFKKRKYNHMELVAQELGNRYNIPVRSDLLFRVKDTEPLYKLNVSERKKTISGAFAATDEIKGKKILLIDDIITTGATINELSKIILEKEPADLIVFCATKSNNCNF